MPPSVRERGNFRISIEKYETLNGIRYVKNSIKLSSVTVDDMGYYYCEENPLIHDTSMVKNKQRELTYVYVFDPNILLAPAPRMVDARIYSDLIIPCRPTHKNAVVNLTMVPSDIRPERTSYDPTVGFTVHNVTDYDAGFWKCKATFRSEEEEKRIVVNVNTDVVPITRGLKAVARQNEVLKGEQISVTCSVTVSRFWAVAPTWKTPNNRTKVPIFKKCVEEVSDESTDSNTIKWCSTLLIEHASLLDSGIYSCHLLNNVRTESLVNIKVYEKSFINVLSTPTTSSNVIEVIKGEMAAIKYSVHAFPMPTFNWFNGTQSISRSSISTTTQLSNDSRVSTNGSTLLIKNVKFSDSGWYMLSVSVENLMRNESFLLIVQDPLPARIENLDPVINADIGDDVLLSCNTTGQPTPTVTWYHKDRIVQESKLSELLIRRVKEVDGGVYICVAENQYGSDNKSTSLNIQGDHQMQVMFAASGVSCLVLILACALIAMRLRKKVKHEKCMAALLNIKDMPLEEQAQCSEYDSKKWEFPRDRLRFGKTLGRGAFGKVIQATAFDLEKSSSCKTVAVKMLKVGSRSNEYRALMTELRILIHLGPHLNIVNLLGACTTKEGPLMVIVEYCRHGNLSNYLRGLRHCYTGGRSDDTSKQEIKKQRLMSDDSADDGAFSGTDETDRSSWITDKRGSRASYLSGTGSLTSHEGDIRSHTRLSSGCEDSRMNLEKHHEANDDGDEKGKEQKDQLTLTDLLSYSLQVARGMEFLASKKCIHRDLAARNVLLSDYQVVKICDFGLARDIYKDPDYVRSGGDARLPIKWMAPESIFDKVYSNKSDVWSFGVLLWEIFTLGGSPYPGLQMDEDFCNKLRRGVRMGKPEHATDSVYSAMLGCWDNNPEDRPTFTKLCEEISDVLQEEAGHEYLDVLKIFEKEAEGKETLRGLRLYETPQETFAEGKNKMEEETSAAVNYTFVKVEDKENEETADETCEEISIVCDDALETNETEENTCDDDIDEHDHPISDPHQACVVLMDQDQPPLYEDVIASRVQDLN
ncbi:vascular endothelial growth factor receptor 1 [Ciona intestinalis]